MSKLKELSQDDLDNITNFLSNIVERKLSNYVTSKEVINQNIITDISYENGQLDVDLDIDIDVDALSNLSQDDVQRIIDEVYEELDVCIDENYRQ
ncbi:DUF3194 domain-containing protein [uncultured Methanobrevibacter sp.]|uniref:DUF3194 domain-containing protein n=1 Tax=uncultured Methanobrevibacter sp. TaxID=253161 RepID=UPI0025E4F4F6|nr:DUF3194 domain-containing protein [uncultured Methanobrevibacter sp.]